MPEIEATPLEDSALSREYALLAEPRQAARVNRYCWSQSAVTDMRLSRLLAIEEFPPPECEGWFDGRGDGGGVWVFEGGHIFANVCRACALRILRAKREAS